MSKLPFSTDAIDWASEWLEIIKANPEIPTDEATMITWFANAIMSGHDEATRRSQDELTTLRARVKEMEGDRTSLMIREGALLDLVSKQGARIRELEEAMRRMIGEHEPGSDCVATGPKTGTAMDYVCVLCDGKKILASRIEAVMRKGEG